MKVTDSDIFAHKILNVRMIDMYDGSDENGRKKTFFLLFLEKWWKK